MPDAAGIDPDALFAIVAAVRLPLHGLLQASLIRNVAFHRFDTEQQFFESHPANRSLTWHSLEALEDSCVVQLVELLRKPSWKAHVPQDVSAAVERMLGHRHVVSHPGHREKDWSAAWMKQFEAEGRRYESRVPLAWHLQAALNAAMTECGNEPLADIVITQEMAGLLRLIWIQSMIPSTIPSIPPEPVLLVHLAASWEATQLQCRTRSL